MAPNKVTPSSIQDMLNAVQADREAKKVFLAMPREEQLLAILGMITFLTSQFAQLQKDNIEYREGREKREKKLVEILDTDPSIKALTPEQKQNTVQKIIALATRPARTGALLDKVLSLIIVIVFILFITGHLP